MSVRPPSHPYFFISDRHRYVVEPDWSEEIVDGYFTPTREPDDPPAKPKRGRPATIALTDEDLYALPAVYVKKIRRSPVDAAYYDHYYKIEVMSGGRIWPFLDYHYALCKEKQDKVNFISGVKGLTLEASAVYQSGNWPGRWGGDMWEMNEREAEVAGASIHSALLWLEHAWHILSVGETLPPEPNANKTPKEKGRSREQSQLVLLRAFHDMDLLTAKSLTIETSAFIPLMAKLLGRHETNVKHCLSGVIKPKDVDDYVDALRELNEELYQSNSLQSGLYQKVEELITRLVKRKKL